MEDLVDSLEKIINLQPKHISVYSLIVEEGTIIHKKIEENLLQLPEEDLERNMYWTTKDILEKNGYMHYEISNFAKKTYESKHNLNCWNQEEYIGVGIAAHSYIQNIRWCNTGNLEEYIEKIKNVKYQEIKEILEIQNIEEKQKEFMILGLRKINGINKEVFKEKFNEEISKKFGEQLKQLKNMDLIEENEKLIKLTNKGLDFANIVWEEFI